MWNYGIYTYIKTSNIRRILGNKIGDHSDVGNMVWQIFVNVGLEDGLLPDATIPLLQPMSYIYTQIQMTSRNTYRQTSNISRTQ